MAVSSGDALANTRYSADRIVALTLGFSALGALFGAIAGAFAIPVTMALAWDFSRVDDHRVYVIAAVLGAIVGAACAPFAGWFLHRRVPLWRAVAGLTVGAVVGAGGGWFIPTSFAHGDGILIAAALGILGAAVVLRLWCARDQRNLTSGT